MPRRQTKGGRGSRGRPRAASSNPMSASGRSFASWVQGSHRHVQLVRNGAAYYIFDKQRLAVREAFPASAQHNIFQVALDETEVDLYIEGPLWH